MPRPLLVLTVVLAAMGACGGSSDKSDAGSGLDEDARAVSVKNFAFSPKIAIVKTGGTVTWSFEDGTAHHLKAQDAAFESADLSSGATFSHTFATAGSHPYVCTIHPTMSGIVSVR